MIIFAATKSDADEYARECFLGGAVYISRPSMLKERHMGEEPILVLPSWYEVDVEVRRLYEDAFLSLPERL